MALYDPDDPISIWNDCVDESDPQNFKYGTGEIFEESPDAINSYILREFDLKAWIALWPMIITLWTLWLIILRGCIHHYSGWQGVATSPIAVILFGGLCIRFTIGFTPQTFIFTKGLPIFAYIIGCEPIGIRRYVARERLQGLSLVRDTGSIKSGGSSTYLYLNWVGLGLPLQVGRYKKHEVAVARAKYISERIDIPVLWPKIYVVSTPARNKSNRGFIK